MARVSRGVTSHARHNKVIKAAKGYYGRRKSTFKTAKQAVDKARQYAYRDRRVRKREFRALWIQRINAAVRIHGMTYPQFMNGVKLAGIEIDRKMLADLAVREPQAFASIVDQAQRSFPLREADAWPRPTLPRCLKSLNVSLPKASMRLMPLC